MNRILISIDDKTLARLKYLVGKDKTTAGYIRSLVNLAYEGTEATEPSPANDVYKKNSNAPHKGKPAVVEETVITYD